MASKADFENLLAIHNRAVAKHIEAAAALEDPRLKGTNAIVGLWQEWRAQNAKLTTQQARIAAAIALAKQHDRSLTASFVPGGVALDYLGQRMGLWGLGALGLVQLGVVGLIVLLGTAVGVTAWFYEMRASDIPEARAAETANQGILDKALAAAVAGGQMTQSEANALRNQYNRNMETIRDGYFNAGRDSKTSMWAALKWGAIAFGTVFLVSRFMPRPSPATRNREDQ